ncbi:DMT family transporter [Aestuariicella hydrocarbonica]|uniref:DMT family transporter n=1 Tax=Pseudomaricurvus hydrocarbonicus TaxID=1470433 RepID=A0A9E5JS72_9GAMM|nr:DMT family transporter [Aestuariicella hydrocarbonica]NHO64426.1 DMT family transporter [Aestuariicella hydrocarbonica]
MSNTTDSTQRGIAFALATAMVGSTAGAAGKLIAENLNSPMIVFVQFSICLGVILPRMLKQGVRSWASVHWKTHLIRGLGGWLSFFAFYTAMGSIPLVDATLLRNTAPLFVPLVVWAWAGLYVPANRWIPLILGFVGIAIILHFGSEPSISPTGQGLSPSGQPLSPSRHGLDWAYLAGLASGLTLAISMVGTRLLSQHDSSGKIMFYYFALSFVLSLPLAIANWQPIPVALWPYLLYIGLSIFLAMWLYTKAYTSAKPSIVSPISYFSVVFAGFLGWVIWGHVPSGMSFLGIAIVISAGVFTVYLGSSANKNAAPINQGE